ncbi:MAG TPA: serine hydrolase domain-containing protein [Acidimicrobiales bacterium]|nr:serine hydrolase domain-containing protein [Acidimicrobiales bacterium]
MTTSLSAAGLHELHDRMAGHVESHQLPGLITLVAGGDEVRVDVVGTPSLDDATPLARDAVFRIASLSKPITAAAAMSLVDDGTLRLDQTVDDVLPELADRRVLRAIDAELDDTVPAQRSITVDDLLSFRMGFGTVMAMPLSTPIQRADAELELRSIGGPPWPPTSLTPDGWMAALGSLPLMYQPGERWMYNTGAQVLGVLVARAAGKDLPTVLHERVCGPLGMRETGFCVPPDQLHRLTTYYAPQDDGSLTLLDAPSDSWWGTSPSFPDASGMLVSTIDDLWAFVSMLLARGVSQDGERVLSEQAISSMTTDRLTADQRAGAAPFLDGSGWGLGMSAPASDDARTALPGAGFGWDGGSGTTWRTEPASGVTGILLTQRAMTSPQPPAVFQDFWAGVNEAIA